jgi:hypothetical protein
MSDSLPEDSLSGSLRVVKLITGEELIGFVTEVNQTHISIRVPALLANYATKTPEGEYVEFVKLVNYLYNLKNSLMFVPRTSIVYSGEPNDELTKMYEAYLILIQNDPKLAMLPPTHEGMGPEHGLELLNELFNNEDFVTFVNDLIENFEGEAIEDIEEEDVESFIQPQPEEEPDTQPKKKKRRKIKPETNKLPYNPENPPEDPQSWSDNPMDYL